MERIRLLSVMEGLGRTSLQGAVLVIIILVAQWVLREQLSPRWRCGLWLVVIARLLLPVSIGSVASVFNLLPHWAGGSAHLSQPAPPQAGAEGERMTGGLVRSADEPSPDTPAAVPEAQNSTSLQPERSLSTPVRPAAAPPTAAERRPQPISRIRLVFLAWLCGAAAMGGYLLCASLSLARRFAGLKALTDPVILGVLQECRSLMKARGNLRVAESSAVACPALYGLFRPRLVLPAGFSRRFSERELRFVFLHELAHLRRTDLPLNWLIACLQVLHWFNPLIWVGFACWRGDRELACDAMALEAAGTNQNREYGQTILRLLADFTRATSTPGLVGILESKQQLRRRIGMIAAYAPTRRWHFLALAVGAAIGITGLTDARVRASVSTVKKEDHPMPTSLKGNPPRAEESRPVVTNGPVMKVLVLDNDNGQALADAEVLAPNQAAFFTGQEHAPLWLTDKDGRANIRLGEVPANRLSEQSWFTLSVRHKAFAPRGMSWSSPEKDVRLSLPKEVVVRLRKGISVGGIVRDEQGAPVPGVHVRIFGTAYWEGSKAEYPEFWTDGPGRPMVVTDEQGHFEARDFPADLEGMVVELIRKDGAFQRFRKPYAGREQDPREPGDPIDLADFRAGKAVFVLKSGFEVRGVVLDPAGRPVPNLVMKAGTGAVNHQRLPEFRTDGSGRFTLGRLLRHQLILTAYPTNFAIVSTVVDVSANTPEVQLRLGPRQPLGIRVVDGRGNPVKGAQVGVDRYRTEAQMLDFSGETDANGRLVWTNAPVSSFALVATSASPRVQQKIRLTPSDREITFKLREGMNEEVIVAGQVRDAKSGEALELESVRYRAGGFQRFEFSGETESKRFRVAVPATRFTPGGMYPSYQIELQVKGYGLLVCPWRDFDEGDWEATLLMEPPTVSGRTVLQPDGTPAANARVWTRADMNDGFVYWQWPNRYSDERMIRLHTDANGKFNLPGIPDDEPIVIVHPEGFLETSLAQIQDKPVLQLQPWATIKGVLKVGAEPKAGIQINLSTLLPPPARALLLSVLTTTARDGSFVFNQVPAGDYKIWRYPATAAARRPGPIAEDHAMPVRVRPGETVTVQYGGTGRTVVGQAKPDKPGVFVDWLQDNHKLTLKQPPAPHLNLEDFADAKTYMRACREFYGSPERLRAAREARTYVLEFESDGSFRADDVPPGDYELSIQVKQPGHEQQFGPFDSPKGDLGSLVRDVIVPPGEGLFDLGALVVPVQGGASGAKPSFVGLDATTLDAKPISLDQFRGKYLVVTFWASWSGRSLEALEGLEKRRAQFDRDPRIEFLAVSLDQNLQETRKTVQRNPSGWKQAWLAPGKAARVTTAFNIDTLPAVFLIGPEGRIIARDLDGERLPKMLSRALAAK